MIIGTAGHIDHGKTALVRALTGLDTDRLREEKERGISIDLGFAHFDDGTGVRAGVVDVPGHERFIRNMLAGAHGMDLALLVVAADDGVMPQTEEHLDILRMLGVRQAVVAITKVDLVATGRRGEVREEIEILLAGSELAGSPVVEVSTVTGEGVEAVGRALRLAMARCRQPEPPGYFRLPVDRVFVMRGHGVVVTGTAVAGSVRADMAVRILPGGGEARVRAVQVHSEPVAEAGFGQRVALNLGGVERVEIARGHVVCDPRLDRVTDCFDARVELCAGARRPLTSHAPVRVYLGTAEVLGRIVWLGGRRALAPQESTFARLILRSPVAAFGADRFVLRDQPALTTIGCGTILRPFVSPHPATVRKLVSTVVPAKAGIHKLAKRMDSRLRGNDDCGRFRAFPTVSLPEGDPEVAALERIGRAPDTRERLVALLDADPAFALAPADLAAAAGLRADTVEAALRDAHGVRPLPDGGAPAAFTTAGKWDRLRDAMREELQDFHRHAPSQPGEEMESLRSRLAADLPAKAFRAVVDRLEQEGAVVRERSLLRLPEHRAGIAPEDRVLATRWLALLNESGMTPPTIKDAAARLEVSPERLRDIAAEIERQGGLVRVSAELCYARDVIERIRDLIQEHATRNGEITAASLRDLIGASRKFSIALLNHFDRTGFTMRVGDARKLRKT